MHSSEVTTMEEAMERLLLMNLRQHEWFSLRMCIQQLSDAGFSAELVRAKIDELARRGMITLVVGHRRHGGNWDVVISPVGNGKKEPVPAEESAEAEPAGTLESSGLGFRVSGL
jgi:hypothetical protein